MSQDLSNMSLYDIIGIIEVIFYIGIALRIDTSYRDNQLTRLDQAIAETST